MGQAASTSQMGRFETEVLTKEANVTALADLSGRWIDAVHARRPTNVVVLDMDSSVSPAHGEQEGTAYNGHLGWNRLADQTWRIMSIGLRQWAHG